MSKRMTKSKSLPWFRIFSKAFITETLGLNATETGIYIRLLAAMNEADEPITGSALNILPRLLGVRQKTFCEAVEKLIERNLIDRLPEGLWAPLMDEERAFRDRNSDKVRSNSVKRWRKTQQNQSGSDANHTHTHREPPNGGSRYEGSTEQSNEGWGTASADAGRSPIGEEEERFFAGDAPSFDGREDFVAGDPPTADEAHSFFAEAFEALCTSGDDPSFAGHKTTATANADASDLQLLHRCERQADWLPEFEKLLIVEMRQTLDAGHDLTAGQRRFLRDEIIPLVRELESQPEPPEIAWDGESEKNSASGETNAPAT